MAAILSKEPPPIDAASGAPAEFQWIVQNCLAKDPDARWQSMGDVAKILKGIAHTSHAPASGRGRASTADLARCRCCWRVGLIAGAMAVSPVAAVEPGRLARVGNAFVAAAGRQRVRAHGLHGQERAVCRRARRAINRVRRRDRRACARCGCRRSAGPEARVLPGTSGASYPFWSPDSQFVGFFADGFLKKVSLAGRSPHARLPRGQRPRRCLEPRRPDCVLGGYGVAALDCECVRRRPEAVHQSSVRIISRTAGRRCCVTAACCCSSGATKPERAGHIRHVAGASRRDASDSRHVRAPV